MKLKYTIQPSSGGYWVRVYSQDGSYYTSGWCYTLWGAKRKIKKLAKQVKEFNINEGYIEV